MRSTYGESLKLTIYGQSHGPHIGVILEGIPAGLPVDFEALQAFLNRRAPGRHEYSSKRKEADIPHFLTGIANGYTTGEPIEAIIPNQDARPNDYQKIQELPRPGHADYTAYVKYGPNGIATGGGQFSGRMTVAMCVAGGLCIQWLYALGIRIAAHVDRIANIIDKPFDPLVPEIDSIGRDFPVLDTIQGELMRKRISAVQESGDSLGGIIECAATGLPTGLGGPLFDGLEGRIAQIVYGIPAVKGIEFGAGFKVAEMTGSENNDSFTILNDRIVTVTNHCGGILGGITNGMPLLFRIAIKPTPSVALPQTTVNLSERKEQIIVIGGRHDPCIVPRAVPVVEAAAAIAIYDAYLLQEVSYETE